MTQIFINQNQEQKDVTVDGMLTLGQSGDGLKTMQFQCMEDVELKKFKGLFDVQGMRDGNLYMEERRPRRKPKRRPMFRQDHSSLSLGVDGMYYFSFRLPAEQVAELPQKLSREASEAAAKMSGQYYKTR